MADKRILLVDDDPFNLQSIKIIVEIACRDLGFPMQVINRIIDIARDGIES